MKGLKFRAQAATEYLMTYGWALLIIIVVAAVLFSLGVFKPSTGTSYYGFTPLTVTGVSCAPSSRAGGLPYKGMYITFTNTVGNTINITGASISSATGISPSSGSVPYEVGMNTSSNALTTGTVLVYPGYNFVVYLNVTCPPAGQTYAATISLTYTTSNGVPQGVSGHVSGTAI